MQVPDFLKDDIDPADAQVLNEQDQTSKPLTFAIPDPKAIKNN